MRTRWICAAALVALLAPCGGCCTPGLYHALLDERSESAEVVSIDVRADTDFQPTARATVQLSGRGGSRVLDVDAAPSGTRSPDGRAMWLDLPPVLLSSALPEVGVGDAARHALPGGRVSPTAAPLTIAELRFAPVACVQKDENGLSLLVDVPPPGGRQLLREGSAARIEWRPQLFGATDTRRSAGDRALRGLGFVAALPVAMAGDAAIVGLTVPLWPVLIIFILSGGIGR